MCDARVYYYQSDSGGRVYFDELGPPWPRHPCTDQQLASPLSKRIISPMPEAESSGTWRSVSVISDSSTRSIANRRVERGWYHLSVRSATGGEPFQVLTNRAMRFRPGQVLFASDWDTRGQAQLSWVEGEDAHVCSATGWRPEFFRGTEWEVVDRYHSLTPERRGWLPLREALDTWEASVDDVHLEHRSKDQIASELLVALLGSTSEGWQLSASATRRVEVAVRTALGYWGRHHLEATINVARALY